MEIYIYKKFLNGIINGVHRNFKKNIPVLEHNLVFEIVFQKSDDAI